MKILVPAVHISQRDARAPAAGGIGYMFDNLERGHRDAAPGIR